jgi:hypothetical protein
MGYFTPPLPFARTAGRFASGAGHRIKRPVRSVPRLIACSALFLFGCGFGHDAAVVVTSPVRLFHHPSPTPAPSDTTTTVTTTPSDAGPSSRPPPGSVSASSPHRPTHYAAEVSPSPSPVKSKEATVQAPPKSKSSPTAELTPVEQNFPTARPVPEKPGYVYSLSEPDKYVDVTGYAAGSKAKDPYSGKIFIVP